MVRLLMGKSADEPSDRILSLREAAQIIYRCQQPSAEQLYRLRQRLESGTLKGRKSRFGRWTTTEASVARYLASRAYRQLASQAEPIGHDRPAKALPDGEQGRTRWRQHLSLRRVYHEVLKDYFLAMIFRRRAQGRSRAFRAAVVAGQVGLFLGLLGFFVVGLRTVGRPLWQRPPAEHLIVEQWLAENESEPRVIRWHPTVPDADSGGVRVRVEYSYETLTGRTIHTDRTFQIHDGRVIGYWSTE